ncbi:3-hydroxyacyl-CoA dehydrogenase NAD-binding domain-containing protein [Frigidibacter oleivorans]|uniref:3-hydroxyacyl-CoA dehydrogenase NAD-binding domain-containing protein n=1 Tax=Frigidibacter oleivorans TaxID=2487129 RepID=UPI000F8F440D|nr:3-hydroxyacyl-CoA dehydrogenase NAD-binding domain-containing protein [Frigidibacter oleivorans]
MTSQTAATPAGPGRVGFESRDTAAGRVVVLHIDNPPVNAGSHGVRHGLVEGLSRACAEGADAVVIAGAGRCFVAGSDLREFGKPLAPPELPDVIRAIEAAPLPVVAALHGVALGGGLELALGCDWRVAAPGTMIGLPEVSLGFVPGAGGTQRMPRLTGQARAIELICDATRIPAETALADGLVDAVVEGDPAEAAIGFLAETKRGKRRTIELTPPAEPVAEIEAAAARATKRGRGRPNVAEAVRLVRASAGPDAAAALADERAVFQQLRLAEDAVALRYLFFAERRAAAVEGLDLALARPVRAVGVIGGGTMGQGIARAMLGAGLPVTLIERDAEAAARAQSAIGATFDGQVAKGRLGAVEARDRKDRLSVDADIAALGGVDLVIEAVFEEMSLKIDLLSRLEAALPAETILATNTSYLDIDAMAAGLSHPDRVLGLHFFSPADVMALLEVVRAARTSDAALATGLKLARRLGKQPVVARVGEGFIGNRVYAAYRRRAELLVLDGAAPEAVDAAITAFGFAMGPFAVADMSGLDIAWAMRKRQAATRDPRARYVAIPDRLCEAGRLGRKTGRGWYDYGSGRAMPDPEVAALIAAERSAAGVTPREIGAEEICRQLMAAIVNEAACLIDEGIAQRPSDVDVALVNGYGFPRWRGGPLYWAKGQDAAAVQADLAALAAAVGPGFRAGPVAVVLARLETAEAGGAAGSQGGDTA